MSVYLSMKLSQGVPNETSRTTTVSATVTVHYSGGSYNGNSPSGVLTIDGQQFNFTCNFNYAGIGQGAITTGNGSVVACTGTVSVNYGTSSTKTVYAHASFMSGTASGTVTTNGSISLTPISSSGGSSGGGGDNSEEWEDGSTSGGSTIIPGNTTIIGQAWAGSTSELNYKRNELGGFGGTYGYVLKFQTPYIGGPSTSLDINLSLEKEYDYEGFSVSYALCYSDKNHMSYVDALTTVDDKYQFKSGVMTIEEFNNGAFSIQTSLLKTEQIYYLYIWLPSDSEIKEFVQISYASQHSINVNYINDGSGDPPAGRLPGNAGPVGQSLLQEETATIPYYTEFGYTVLFNNGSVKYSNIVVLKFITPAFNGTSISVDVNLYNVSPSQRLSYMCCALCTSDENNGMYIDAASIVNDPNQIASVILTNEELSQSAMPFTINTSELESQKYYYLFFWVPTDITDGGTVDIGAAKYHGININYNVINGDDGNGGTDDIVTSISNISTYINTDGSGFHAYDCYIYEQYITGYHNYTTKFCDIIGQRRCIGYTYGSADFAGSEEYELDSIAYWGNNGTSACYSYHLKFVTPNFPGTSSSITFSIQTLSGKMNNRTDTDPLMNFALCTSDENYAKYTYRVDVPDDEFIIKSGTFNEVLGGTTSITIDNLTLYPNTTYYLFVWDTNRSGDASYVNSAKNHTISVTCLDVDRPTYSYGFLPYGTYTHGD